LLFYVLKVKLMETMLIPGNRQNERKSAVNHSNSQTSFFKPVIQPKLSVNEPGDHYEQEADAMADRVMRMSMPSMGESPFFKPAQTGIQRKCEHCEEEEKLHRKESSGAETHGGNELDSYVGSLGSSGQALPESSRQFFESRFGQDFSNVRIHTDSVAAKSAQSINALAYTTGNNIVFNNGQYSPESDSGKKLMAHELTHVVQQEGSISRKIQRALGVRTRCTANADSAPADPRTALQAANDRAVLTSLGTSLLLFSESLFIQDATFGASSTFTFYRRRFGDPVAVGAKFRNRFNNTLHDTLLKAQASELQFLSKRLETISHFLEGNIHFKCTGTTTTTIGSCTHHCGASTVLASCSAGHGSEMAICPGFWGVGAPDQQAIGMIHEISHMLFHLGDHDTAPFAQSSTERRTEPECYSSLVADIYGITPFDPSCPII
jgi:hypothetical protein